MYLSFPFHKGFLDLINGLVEKTNLKASSLPSKEIFFNIFNIFSLKIFEKITLMIHLLRHFVNLLTAKIFFCVKLNYFR